MSHPESPSTTGAGTVTVPAANNSHAPSRALVPVPARPENARQLNLPALLAALRRRWLLAAVLGTIAALIVGAAVWTLLPPPKTVVRAVVHIATKRDFPLPQDR